MSDNANTSESNRLLSSFEKASQELFKETWEFGWSVVGVIALLVLVGFGIYFSQIAIASVIGGAGLMLYFTWAAAISISALEVGGIKLLGDKTRSEAIKASNVAEHKISKWFTYGLFVFDIITNWAGLYITAIEKIADGATTTLGIGGYVLIGFFGALMAISEILVGWMIRSVATSYVSFRKARQKFESYKSAMERDVAETTRNEFRSHGGGGQNNQEPRNNQGQTNQGQRQAQSQNNAEAYAKQRRNAGEEPRYHPASRASSQPAKPKDGEMTIDEIMKMMEGMEGS